MWTSWVELGRDGMDTLVPPAMPLLVLVASFMYWLAGPWWSPLMPTPAGSELHLISMDTCGEWLTSVSIICRDKLQESFLLFHCERSCLDWLVSMVACMVALRRVGSSKADVWTLGRVLKVTMLSLPIGTLGVMTSTLAVALFRLVRELVLRWLRLMRLSGRGGLPLLLELLLIDKWRMDSCR